VDASRETSDASLVHQVAPARAGEAPHPTLLLLHGRGADELDLLGLGPELDPRFFIVSARAPYAWMGGYRWYELEGPGREDAASFGHSLGVLQGFVEELTAAYPVHPTRLFLLGFSQGAVMANALTLSAPQRVAGAVLLSGFQPNLDSFTVDAEGIKGKPFFVAHGTLDPLLGVELGRTTRQTLSRLGADVTYREYDMGHQIIAPELADFDTWLKERLG
jgi:phospholipase/carboxylesterase